MADAPLADDLLAALRAAVAGTTGPDLVAAAASAADDLTARSTAPEPGRPYGRRILHVEDDLEVMLATWAPGERCAPHDHGGSRGCVLVLEGTFEERRYGRSDGSFGVVGRATAGPGDVITVRPALVHDMVGPEGGRTLHAYSPAPKRMDVYDLDRGVVHEVVGDVGAWLPDEPDHPAMPIDDARPARGASPADDRPVIWVSYTTRYRGGSAAFAAAAATMAHQKAAEHPDAEVVLTPLDGKADFRRQVEEFAADGRQISELHFIGHSGLYGPMFRSVDWPEQFSPHEWRTMAIPFAPDGRAAFHACRTARWFAPFFARTFGVPTSGNHGYTTVSARSDRFAWAGRHPERRGELYLVATPGRRSHGLVGSVRKYAAPVEPMTEYLPEDPHGAASYDRVADLYDRAYVDIKVREREWAWVLEHVARARADVGGPLRVLEVGCGNGALLRELDDLGHVASGVGLDASAGMVERAQARTVDHPRLCFDRIDGPRIELEDHSVDVVLSFLSFRYLDWDPIMAEVRRVLAPGGRLWVVDMVAKPVGVRDLPKLAASVVDHVRTPRRHPAFARDVAALTSDPDWKAMLRYNPIRAEHEYRWYLESRFPNGQLEVLTVSPTDRVVAFDSGPLEKGRTEPLSFP